MKLLRLFMSFAVLAAFAFCLPGVISAQEEKEKPKTVPATKIKPQEPKEKEEEDEKEDVAALDIGAKAPKLALTDWVKGKEIEEFKPGQIYVIEFWATWCGPCKLSMPHLGELQTKYGDKVQVIGISDEETELVTEFLKKDQSKGKTWDEVVTYALAMDDERKTTTDYRIAAGERGIPTAFIIGEEGIIEWIGHPMEMDKPLEEISNGKWDRNVAKLERAEAKATEFAMMKAMDATQKGDTATAVKILDGLLAKEPSSLNLMFMKLQALETGKDKKALAKYADELVVKIDEMIAKQPEAAQLGLFKLEVMSKGSDQEAAVKFTEEVLKKNWEEPMFLNQIAWGIAADKNVAGNLEIALKAAKHAVELTEEKDGTIIDTLARVYFEQGKLDEAIEWQKKAVKLSDRKDVAAALKRYEAAKEEKK